MSEPRVSDEQVAKGQEYLMRCTMGPHPETGIVCLYDIEQEADFWLRHHAAAALDDLRDARAALARAEASLKAESDASFAVRDRVMGLERDLAAMTAERDALLALEASTCPACKGDGGEESVTICGDGQLCDFAPCPACSGTGKRAEVTP